MHSNKHYSKQKKLTLTILIVLIIAVLLAALLIFLSRLERSRDVAPEGAGTAASLPVITDPPVEKTPEPVLETPAEDDELTIFYNGQKYRYNTDLSVLLVMGIDDYDIETTAEFRNHSQSDFLMLAVFDHADRTYKLIEINRDTMVDDPVIGLSGSFIGYNYEQIALSHTYGHGLEDSCENTVHAITHLLYETPIDNYFALTMSAIPIMNDLVGGVTVTVEDNFEGIDDTLVQGETVTLTSENVEHYVRSRMWMPDDPTNINRMKRQHTYMAGLMSLLGERIAADSSFAMDAYFAVADYLVTDCSVDELNAYVEQFSDYTSAGSIVPEGEAVLGEEFMEFYVDEAALQQMVIDTFYLPVED